jgi:lysylphosphatidylglycerol synthetase-like protein (DUF2156 family)
MKSMQQQRKASGDIFAASLIILIGSVLLLNNFKILPWSIWSELWHFWPVILILAGLQMLTGKSSIAESLVNLIGIILLIFVILLAIASVNRNFDNWMKQEFPQWPRMYKRFDNFNSQDFNSNMFDSGNFSI